MVTAPVTSPNCIPPPQLRRPPTDQPVFDSGDPISSPERIDAATPSQTMAERYGATSASRRWVMITLVAVVAAALLGWLMWAAWFHSNPPISVQLHSYDVVSTHRVHVTIDVHSSDSAAVTCTLKAQADDHSVVGEEQVTIPGGKTSTRFETWIKTGRQATNATVSDCR